MLPPTHQNTAVTVIQTHVYSRSDIKRLLNRNVGKASGHKELEWLRIYSMIQRSSSGVEDWQSKNHYQGIRSLDPKLLTGSVSPILWQNPEGSIYRSSNVRDEAYPLRDSCCTVEPAAVWEDHQENSASGNTTKTPSATSAYISPSPQKPYACKDCQVFLITKSKSTPIYLSYKAVIC